MRATWTILALAWGGIAAAESARGVVIEVPVADAEVSAETARVEARATGAWADGRPLCLTAVVTFPDGAVERVSLHDDGNFGDDAAGDGRFANWLAMLEQAGKYTVRVKAWQTGQAKWSESRTFTLTAPTTKPATTPVIPPLSPRKPVWPWVVLGMVCGCVGVWVTGRVVARKVGAAEPAGEGHLPTGEDEAPAEPPTASESPSPPLTQSPSHQVTHTPTHPDTDTGLREGAEGAEQALQDQRRQLFSSLAEMLVQLPSVRKAVADGAALQARDVLPMLTPLDSALERLGFERLGQPGERVPFDPTRHQMASAQAPPEPGTPVEVVFVGYLEGGDVLRKAQVNNA